MRIVSFLHGSKPGWGVHEGEFIADASALPGPAFATAGAMLRGVGLQDFAKLPMTELPRVRSSEVKWLAPITDPGKIICVGLNYLDHVGETNLELPPHPAVFSRFADSIVGHGGTLIRPRVSEQLDYEGELALIVGRHGRHIAEDVALEYVAGYCCFNDGSVRDWQKHSVTAGKNFIASGSLGPAMVTADEVDDPRALTLRTRINGHEVQHTSTGNMIYSIARLISYVSDFVRLEPGDVIATGTPSGVGSRQTPPRWLKPGDEVEVEIEGIGVLRNTVADEA